MRAGKRTAHVPEKFTFEQVLWNRRTVDLDQRLIRPRAVRVDCPCDHFLADTRLTEHEHRGRRRGHRLDLRQGALERAALTDDLAKMNRDIEFVTQVIALELELFFQRTDLGKGFCAFFFDCFACGDIAEHDDRAVEFAVAPDGCARVFDRHRLTVRMPEHFILLAVDFAIPNRRVNRAVFARVRGTVGM